MGYSSQHDIECHTIVGQHRNNKDMAKYYTLANDSQTIDDKPFLRCVQELNQAEVIQIHAGRISLALSRQNMLYIWDCLKMNSMQKIEL